MIAKISPPRMFGMMMTPEEELAQLKERVQKLRAHRAAWDATLYQTPPGWNEHTATAYRMAMAWAVSIMEGERD